MKSKSFQTHTKTWTESNPTIKQEFNKSQESLVGGWHGWLETWKCKNSWVDIGVSGLCLVTKKV